MKGQSFRCVNNEKCNSPKCKHKELHEKNDTCVISCKWGDCICTSDITEYTRSILTDVMKGGITVEDALDAIITAVSIPPLKG